MKKSDKIFIRGQLITCNIGVPDEERARPQDLLVHTCLYPVPFDGSLDEDIGKTIDYHAVSIRIEEVAGSHPRKLIETLAEDLAEMVLTEFDVSAVKIEIEKFILPNTVSVGVCIKRKACKKQQ